MIVSFCINGLLFTLETPKVMAIINTTDDSFYADSRCITDDEVLKRAETALEEGADILDIGGCSTRPNSTPVSAETEWRRVCRTFGIVRKHFPDTILSLDTFRAEIAQRALQEFGGMIINDVSGLADEKMVETVAAHNVPYILTHCHLTALDEDMLTQITDFFARKIDILQRRGVKDIIIDPGFGFNKTTEQNWQLMSSLNHLQIFSKPILAGISRKRMIQEILNCAAKDALNGTTATHILALSEGARILRAHDVMAAKQAITIYLQYKH